MFSTGFILFSIGFVYGQTLPQTRKPNFVVIMADDLGFNDVGYTLASDAITPNIDWLAENGIILPNYYTYGLCTPSRAAFMTGRYTWRYGLQTLTIRAEAPYGLPLTENTLSWELHQLSGPNSYRNYLVGKWHLGFSKTRYTPPRRDFDEFYGIWNGAIDRWTMKTNDGLASSIEAFDFHDGEEKVNVTEVYDEFKSDDLFEEGYFADDDWTRKCIEYIGRHQTNGSDADRPVFVWMSFVLPHTPVQTQAKFLADPVDDTPRGRHLAMVANLDYNVGLILDALKSDEILWNNTYVIFVSDNGGIAEGNAATRNVGSNWPFRGHKSSVWNGAIRFPAVISGGLLPLSRRGTIYDGLTHVSDWFTTFLALANRSPERVKGIDGNDLSALFETDDGVPDERSEIIIELDKGGPRGHPDCLTYFTKSGEDDIRACGAIIMDGYKLVISTNAYEHNTWTDGGFKAIPGQDPYDHWVDGVPDSDIRLVTCPLYPGGPHDVPTKRIFQTEFLNEDWKGTPAVGFECPYDPWNQTYTGCLFNMTTDACETTDLGQHHPMYTVLMNRLYDLISSDNFMNSLYAANSINYNETKVDSDGFWCSWETGNACN